MPTDKEILSSNREYKEDALRSIGGSIFHVDYEGDKSYDPIFDLFDKEVSSYDKAMQYDAFQAYAARNASLEMLDELLHDAMEEVLQKRTKVSGADLSKIAKVLGSKDRSKEEVEKIEMALSEFFETFGYQRGGPERTVRMGKVLKSSKIEESRENPVSRHHPSDGIYVELDISSAINFIKYVKSKDIFTEKNIKELSAIVHKESILKMIPDSLSNVFYDYSEDYESDIKKRLAQGYLLNEYILESISDLEALESGLYKNKEKQLAEIKLLSANTGLSDLVSSSNQLLLEIENAVATSLHILNNMAGRINEYVKNFRISDMEIGPEYKTEFAEILTIFSILSVNIQRLLQDILSSRRDVSGSVISGVFSGGLLFQTSLIMINSVINRISSYLETSFDDPTKPYTERQQLWKRMKENIADKKKKISSDIYEFSQKSGIVGDNEYVEYTFSLSDELSKEFNNLGFHKDMIESIRGIVSKHVYGRSGLDNEVLNYIEDAVIFNFGGI